MKGLLFGSVGVLVVVCAVLSRLRQSAALSWIDLACAVVLGLLLAWAMMCDDRARLRR